MKTSHVETNRIDFFNKVLCGLTTAVILVQSSMAYPSNSLEIIKENSSSGEEVRYGFTVNKEGQLFLNGSKNGGIINLGSGIAHVSCTDDSWFLYMANVESFRGRILSYDNVLLDVVGDTSIVSDSIALNCRELSIAGSGTLHVRGGGSRVIQASLFMAYNEGGLNVSGTSPYAIYCSEFALCDSTLKVDISGCGVYAAYGGMISGSSATLNCGDVCLSSPNGPFIITQSYIQAKSSSASAFMTGDLNVKESVLCLLGKKSGIHASKMPGSNFSYALSPCNICFEHVYGCIMGENSGFSCGSTLGGYSLTFANSDLLIGSGKGGVGIDLPVLHGLPENVFIKSGTVMISAPDGTGISAGAVMVEGGNLSIARGVTKDDFRKFFLVQSAVAKGVVGNPSFGSPAAPVAAVLENAYNSVVFSSIPLMQSTALPQYGIVSQRVSFSGGRTNVKAGGAHGYALVSEKVSHAEGTFIADGGAMRINGFETYTVKFSANGGKLPKGKKMAPQKMTYGRAAKLRKNVFTRKSHVFVGWAVKKGGPAKYRNAQKVKNLRMDGKDVLLYAVWAKKTYKVAFNAYGGTLPKGKKMAAQKMVYGKAAKLTKNVFVRKGYVFAGWAKSKADAKKGVIAFANAAAVKNLSAKGGTVTLYAVWAKPAYKVAFYANGGTGKTVVQAFKYGKAGKLAACKFKAPKGKKFAGWATSAANAKAGKVKYRNGTAIKGLVITGKTVKLYAVWKIK